MLNSAMLKTLLPNWRVTLIQYLAITLAAVVDAANVIIFLSPFNIAPSGVSGLAVILNKTAGTPIGLMVFLGNIPIQILALRMMPSGWRTVVRTIYAIIIYTVALDVFDNVLPATGVSNDALLSTIFAGIITGITGGIIFRSGGTLGGTSTLALLIQRRIGTPMSTTYLYADILVVGLAGFIFGWEPAMLALTAIFISGVATDYILEGPSIIRTCVIITDKPQEIAQAIMTTLDRGVTSWEVKGMYTGEPHQLLYITISRTQVEELKHLVATIDPAAFLVVGHGHTAYGEGFRQAKANQLLP